MRRPVARSERQQKQGDGGARSKVREEGYSLAELREAGYGAAEARALGRSAAELKAAGYVAGIKAAGYSLYEAKAAGYSSVVELCQAGFALRKAAEARASTLQFAFGETQHGKSVGVVSFARLGDGATLVDVPDAVAFAYICRSVGSHARAMGVVADAAD